MGVTTANPYIVALSSGLAIASAGFALAWGTESLQFIVSQAFSLAVLALVEVLPEYSVEVVLAYRGAFDPTILHYATAAMTGANRLLIGLGWPAVFLLSAYASRGKGGRFPDLVLEGHQALEVMFLGLATLYSFVIFAKGTLGVFDAVLLLALFGAYVYVARKLPAHGEERVEELEGPARAIAVMKGRRRLSFIFAFLALGALVIIFGSAPFVSSLLDVSKSLNLDQYLFIQWLTPVLTELPEAITVFYWAAKTGKGSLALASLVSSKLNQWTLLVGTIPVAYAAGLGGLGSIVLTPLQGEEMFLTASQSLFGFVCLTDLRLTRYDATILLILFTAQLVFPPVRLEVGALYLIFSVVELARKPGRLTVFSQVYALVRAHVI